MELFAYWKIIRKRLWLILLLLLMAGAGSVYYVAQQLPLYRTSTTLIINPSALSSALSYEVINSVMPLANTYTELMQTRSFVKLVADALDVVLSESEILGAISAQYVRDTQLFRITATHPNPQVAQALANATARVLVEANLNRLRAEQSALLEAQVDTNRVAERDRLVELNKVLQEELTLYNDRIKRIEGEIANVTNGPPSDTMDARILSLREELLGYRSERISVLSSLADAQTALVNTSDQVKSTNMETVVVLEEAPLPIEPLPRNMMQPIIAALAAAFALGIGIAWLLEYIDYTIKTPEELETVYGMPTQGVIGIIGNRAEQLNREDNLITMNQPRSPVAEAFRSLRTSIRMAGLGKPVRSLLITSAGPGEGKTFITANLAVSMAQEGKRIILVDTDLRRPQVHRVFGLRREPGFTDLVVDGKLVPDHVLQATALPTLKILACGVVPPNPAELLGSARAAEIMRQLAEQADMVIYDSPPAATVTDAVILVPQVDAVLQVVQARAIRIDLVRRCKTLLERAGGRILGPILNKVQTGDLGYYHYYYYYGHYHRNGDEPEKSSSFRQLLPGGRARRQRSGLRRLAGDGQPTGVEGRKQETKVK